MESGLFRQKSIERISSPEDLHDYMRVTSPRLWMLLAAIAVLLGGFIAYASTVTMENKIDIEVEVCNYNDTYEREDGTTAEFHYTSFNAVVDSGYKDVIDTDKIIRIGDETGKVDLVAMTRNDDGSEVMQLIIEMDDEEKKWEDGVYGAELVLEQATPISFLWNTGN